MTPKSRFWRQDVFTLTMFGCILFVVLTVVAMLFYPGGTLVDPTTSGYSFLTNYFSDLGLTWTHARLRNTVSAILFVTALVSAAVALVLSFLAFPQFFSHSRSGKFLSGMGSIFGAITGVCFIGVAFTPANLYLGTHLAIMMWAFRTFSVAVICYTIVIFCERDYPNRFGFVFVAFAALLVLYVLLLAVGPPYDSPEGIVIQAVGQKIIVYASVISILIQAFGARRVAAQLEDAGKRGTRLRAWIDSGQTEETATSITCHKVRLRQRHPKCVSNTVAVS